MEQPTIVDLTSLSDSESEPLRASGSCVVRAQHVSKTGTYPVPCPPPSPPVAQRLAPYPQANAKFSAEKEYGQSRETDGQILDAFQTRNNGVLGKAKESINDNFLFLGEDSRSKGNTSHSATETVSYAGRGEQVQRQLGLQAPVAVAKTNTSTGMPTYPPNLVDVLPHSKSNFGDQTRFFYHHARSTRDDIKHQNFVHDSTLQTTISFSLYNQPSPAADRTCQSSEERRPKRSKTEAPDYPTQGDYVPVLCQTSQPHSAAPQRLKAQATVGGKRRGRPPGSRNKEKLGKYPSRLNQRPNGEFLCTSTLLTRDGSTIVHFPSTIGRLSKASILRRREFGGHPGLNQRVLQIGLRQSVLNDRLAPWKYWEGASKDVITSAWSPNGLYFAAGASTDLDSLNVQYNRNNNLLWADIEHNCISELVNHHIPRLLPLDIHESSEITNTHNTLDSRVFTTVSSIDFNSRGNQMYSSSYDHSVKVWEVYDYFRAPECATTLRHTSRVELLSGHEESNGHILATAQCNSEQPISLWQIPSDNPESSKLRTHFSSERVKRMGLSPTALSWGTLPAWTEHLLIAGFAENKNNAFDRDRQGDLLIWDVNTSQPLTRLTPAAQCVFDLAWHPRLTCMAAATTPSGQLTTRSTKSVIRTWNPLESPSRIMEFECPALDINEILFNPLHENYISVACTNGCAYVWDVRRPDGVLSVLQHGDVIEQLDEGRRREEQDTGMRFMSWSFDGSSLYTGSSDGLIKQWNPFVSEEDCHIRDVATFDSGVMTGTFSPDGSNLLIGLCKGSIQVLSVAAPCEPADNATEFTYRASR